PRGARWGRGDVSDRPRGEGVLREVGPGPRWPFEASLERLGLPPRLLNVVMELPSNEAARHAVEVGCGVTVIPELVAEAALRSNALKRVAIDLPSRPFFVIRHRQRYPPQPPHRP